MPRFSRLLLCLPLLLVGGSALADDAPELIEVTGSHIKRVDVEGVAPVETVTREDLDKKGYDNLGDVVRDLGVNSFGSDATINGNTSEPGNSDISLRGLGADNTLVLLNGQRLPQDAISGTVDVNLIPMAAVERIEILKDGASAIYGSDALGGVVNIITRKDFQGTELSATQMAPTAYSDGLQTNITAVNGINTERLNVVTSLGFRFDSAINSRNRPWSNNSYSMIGSPGSYASIDGSGNDGTWNASPNCPSGLTYTTPDGTFCRFKYSDYSQESPTITQIGGMSEAHYELSSKVKLNARLSFVYRDAQTIAAPSPATSGQVTIPWSVASGLGLPGATSGEDLDVMIRLTALGTRNTDVGTNSYGGVLGATIQLPHDWEMKTTASYNLVTSSLRGVSGYALGTKVADLISSGAFNPFAAAGSQGSMASASYVPTENTQTDLAAIEIGASGDLFQGWAGPFSLAMGGSVNYTGYNDVSDAQTLAGNVLGNAGSSGSGHRVSEALYSELSAPLVEKKLEAQLAGRVDNFSDFGATANPKAGLLYHVTPNLLIRSSIGTGFRAPLLTELYAGQSVGYPPFIDAVACAAHPGSIYCEAQQYQVTSGGNPNLKQETSFSYTLGAVYSPSKSVDVGTDWFFTRIANMPGIDYNDMTTAEKNGVDPSTYGVTINRDNNGFITSVVAPLQNLSAEQEIGVDITGSWSFGKFKLATEQNQFFEFKEEGFPGAGFVNKLGWNAFPAWRNTSALTYTISDRHALSLTARTIPGQLYLDKSGSLQTLTTLDLSYSFKSKKIGDITLAVVNLLGSLPPYDPSNPTGMVNYSLYDPNGCQIVLGYKKAI